MSNQPPRSTRGEDVQAAGLCSSQLVPFVFAVASICAALGLTLDLTTHICNLRASKHYMDQPESKGVRILSLDGGDRRAISQLMILDSILRRVEWDTKSETRILPCDYFDMISGVGTGGIMVVLLAVLRLSIEDAIEEFLALWNSVFVDVSLDQVARSEKLETMMENLLERKGIPANRMLAVAETKAGDCKAFVCAVPESNLGPCEKFRDYYSRASTLSPTIIEAVRATCAIPSLFTSVSIKSVGARICYTTGTYSFNNPTWEMIKEACEHFGRDHPVACILSLGCGQRIIRITETPSGTGIADSIEQVVSDSEVVEKDLSWRIGKSNIYHRFQVDTSATSSVEEICSYTMNLLGQPSIIERIDQCAAAAERPGRKTLRDISGLVEERPGSAHGLPSLSAFFVERPELIKKMADCVFRIGPSAQRRMVISGLGGIGKTQITVSFLMQFLSRFRHVLFIDASSVQTIESGLIAKVKSLGVKYSRETAIEALDVLANPDEEVTQHWAIVYDNADGKDIVIKIAQYFPRCSFGTIILTTRNPNLGNLAPSAHIKLDIMSEHEAVDVLLRSAIIPPDSPTEVDRQHGRDIARALGYLPVALVQAGYFINQHDCMQDYLPRLLQLRPDILQRPAEGQLDDHPHGVYDTFEVTWPHLSLRAQLFLNTLGFVNYTGFPLELIYRAAKHDFRFEPNALVARPVQFEQSIQLLRQTFQPSETFRKQDVDDLVAEIEKYSLVTRMTTFTLKMLRFHPLVHSWIHDRLKPHERETHRAAAVRLLVCGTGEDDEDIFEFIYPHVTLLTDPRSLHINDRAGLAVIQASYDVELAIGLWEDILTDINATPGDHTLRTGDAKLKLAALYRRRPRDTLVENALPVFTPDEGLILRSKSWEMEQEVVEYRLRTLGCDDPETMKAITLQAIGMATSNDSQEHRNAPKPLQTALDLWDMQPRKNWELICQLKEALAYPRFVEYPLKFDTILGQIKLGQEVIDMRTKHNGAGHWKTLAAKTRLADFYSELDVEWIEGYDSTKLGRDERVDLWTAVVAKRKNARGPLHPDTIFAIQSLAESHQNQGSYQAAETEWKETISLWREVKGPKDNLTLTAMSDLGKMYAQRGRYNESEAVLKEAIELWKGTREECPDRMLDSIETLAELYSRCKKYRESEKQWKGLIALPKRTPHLFFKFNTNAMNNLAAIYYMQERYDEAEVQWKELIAFTKGSHARFHGSSLWAMDKLAAMYFQRERYDEAEVQWKELMALTKGTPLQFFKPSLSGMYNLASMRYQQERYDEAEAQWKELIALTKGNQAQFDESSLWAMDDLARMYLQRKRYDEAEVQWRELITLKRQQGVGGQETLDYINNLAWAYYAGGRKEKAEHHWKEAIALTKNNDEPIRESTLCAMAQLALLYHDSEKHEESEVLRKEIISMQDEADGPFHPHRRQVMFSLARQFEKRGLYRDADAILIDGSGGTGEIEAEIAELLKRIHSKLGNPPEAAASEPPYHGATPYTPSASFATVPDELDHTAIKKLAGKRQRSPDDELVEGALSAPAKRSKCTR